MATIGFSATDEQKAKVDQLAEQWIKDNGGNKADFLSAAIAALENANAKEALAGRADEIDHVEKLLDGIRVAYMSSLSIAMTAKDEAATAAAKEIEKAKSLQDTLQSKIDELTERTKEAEQKAELATDETDRLQKAFEAATKRAEAAELTLEEQRESHKILSDRLVELEKNLNGYEKVKEKAERAETLEKELADLKKRTESEAKLAAQTAAAELREAVAAERERYAVKLAEMLDAKKTETKTEKKGNVKKPASKKPAPKKVKKG